MGQSPALLPGTLDLMILKTLTRGAITPWLSSSSGRQLWSRPGFRCGDRAESTRWPPCELTSAGRGRPGALVGGNDLLGEWRSQMPVHGRAPQPRNPRNDEASGGQMGLLEHLDELRTRIIRSCIAIGCGMLVAFFFVDRIGDFILEPTLRTLPPGETIVYTKPGEGLAFYFDLALIGGLVLSAPYVMYQIWRFIAPGLYATEKKFVIPFVALTSLGSFGGALFAHYLLFPSTIGFLATFHSGAMTFLPTVENTFALYKGMMIGMVVVFQMPTMVFFLAKMRLVTARFLWRHIKYAILAIFILAAVLTASPDPWNQLLFAAPMVGLYLLSIAIAWIVEPKSRSSASQPSNSRDHLRLVFAATVIDKCLPAVRRPRRTRHVT
jgi:sec-independent protein translocase protein TatC